MKNFLLAGMVGLAFTAVGDDAQAQCYGNSFGRSYGGFRSYGYQPSYSSFSFNAYSPRISVGLGRTSFGVGRTSFGGGHYDYHPPSLVRHRNHYHVVPGHYDYHHPYHRGHH